MDNEEFEGEISEERSLPVAIDSAIESGMDPEEIVAHMDDVGEYVSELTEEVRTGNVVYAQSHVLQRAVELLREAYDEAEHPGEREAEMMAVAIILDREAEETVW